MPPHQPDQSAACTVTVGGADVAERADAELVAADGRTAAAERTAAERAVVVAATAADVTAAAQPASALTHAARAAPRDRDDASAHLLGAPVARERDAHGLLPRDGVVVHGSVLHRASPINIDR